MKNNSFWFILPTLVLVSITGFLPMMVVVNYSLHYLFPGSIPHFAGLQNFIFAFGDMNFITSVGRQFLFTIEVLLIEVPLGLALAHTLPRKGAWVGVCLVLLGIPLLIPWSVVGTIWKLFTRPDIGALT